MKALISTLFLLFAASSACFAQIVSSSASSSVSDSTIYFVDGKILTGEALKKIPYDKIATVDVVKKDTLINGKLFRDRIYVRLKKEQYPQK